MRQGLLVDPAGARLAIGLQTTIGTAEATMRLKRPTSIGLNHDDGTESGAAPGARSDKAVPVGHAAPTEAPADDRKPEGGKPGIDDPRPVVNGPVEQWVDETERAVVRAREVGSPAAWRTAAQAAVVVAEMAQTMRVTTHAHQIAEQLAHAAEIAAQEAHEATQAAAEATQAANVKKRAAEEAEHAAQVAALAAASARRKTEQTALAAPKAVEAARVAAQAAANARGTADQLDQVVTRARQVNTPEAWSEALQIAAALWAKETGPNTSPEDRLERPA